MSARTPAKQEAGKAAGQVAGQIGGKVAGKAVVKAASALRLSRLREPRPLRLRLVDAVTLAAAGLLVLKLLSLSHTEESVGTELPAFARALAQARTGYEPKDPATTGSVGQKDQEKAAEKPAEPPRAQPPLPEAGSATERALLEKLGARREALRQKSEELELRERMIGEAERKLEAGVGELRQAEDKAEGAGRERVEAERAGMKNIVTMYETMKPKDAARVFDRLGHEVLVPLVVAMNPRKMAEVLAVMQPEAAERLTVALANRARGVAPAQQAPVPGLPPNELPAIDPGAAR